MIEAQPIEVSGMQIPVKGVEQPGFRQRLVQSLSEKIGNTTEKIGNLIYKNPSLILLGVAAILTAVSTLFVISEDKTIVTPTPKPIPTPFSILTGYTISDSQYESLYNQSVGIPISRPLRNSLP